MNDSEKFEEHSRQCSFCGRTNKNIERLIQGSEVSICNKCVTEATSILCEGNFDSLKTVSTLQSVVCNLCGSDGSEYLPKRKLGLKKLLSNGSLVICSECVVTCLTIIIEGNEAESEFENVICLPKN